MEHSRIPISSGIKAVADIKPYTWTKDDGAGGLVPCTAAADVTLGLTKGNVCAGHAGALIKQGRYTSRADGGTVPILVDDELTLGDAGQLIKHDGTAGNRIVARALEGATEDGVELDVFVFERWIVAV